MGIRDKAMLQMLGVLAEFERRIIRERVNARLAGAKREGHEAGPPLSETISGAANIGI